MPGGEGAGPLASEGPASATGGSPNLSTRGRQSKSTGRPSNEKTELIVVHWNAEGVQRKKSELQAFLHSNKVDIACVQETHLNANIRFFIRGYESFRCDRPTGHKGGVMTLVKHGIPATQTSDLSNGETEHITIKVFLPDEGLTVTNCYSPPTSKLHLQTFEQPAEKHLFVGDLNCHSPAWGYPNTDAKGEELQDWMIDNKLILINTPHDKPTHYSRAWKKNYHPDIAFATESIQKRTSKMVHSQLGGSDHLPVMLNIAATKAPLQFVKKRASWNFKKANWSKYHHHTENLSVIDMTDDINRNTKAVTASILSAAKKSIPRGFRKNYKPYWSKTLATLHTKLSDTRDRMEQNPVTETTSEHNKLKQEFNATKAEQLRRAWNEKTSSLNLDNSTGKLWHLVKTLNEDTTTHKSTTVLEEGGHFYTGKKAADILAKTFEQESTTKPSSLRRKEVESELKAKLSQPSNPAPSMTSDLTMAELNDAIRHLKNKKAPGKDGICNEMIKRLCPDAKKKLLELFNQSWRTGVFPTAWKEAIITPILKKGKDPRKKTSYRPISLLSCLGKTLERIINKRLMHHLESNNLINAEQTAFRKNRNTEDQLIYLTQSIENAFQEKKKVVATFIDLSKAFDKVWKKGLLLKMKNAEIHGLMYAWIKSFLSHRTARVKLNDSFSQTVKIREGVPQGGVISPTLFNIFINDITKDLSRHISRALHADDFAVWHASESLATATIRMQEALDLTAKWAKDWCVTINSLKTVSTCFSLSNTKEKVSLSINNVEIPQEDSPTYLGVTLDKRLTWSAHTQEAERKATRRLSIMKKLAGTNWGANSSVLKQVYTGNVRPAMEYGSTAWVTAAKTNTNRLAKVQNAGMRIITGAMKTTPIHTLETTTGLASLDHRREERVLIEHEKLQRLPSYPVHNFLQENTKKTTQKKQLQPPCKETCTIKQHPYL